MKFIYFVLPVIFAFHMSVLLSQNADGVLRQQVHFYKNAINNPALSPEQQLNYSEKLFDIAASLPDTNVMIFSLKKRGEIYHNAGKYALSRNTYNAVLDILPEAGYDTVKADVLYNLAVIFKNEQKYDDAVYYLKQSLRIDSALNRINAIANSYNLLGMIFNEQQSSVKAVESFKESINLFQKTGNNEELGLAYANLGFAYQSIGATREAVEYFNKAGNILSGYSGNTRYASLLNVIQEANKKIMQAEITRKRTQTIFLLLVLILAIFIIIIIIRLYNVKKRTAHTILKQKNEIEEKNHQIESSLTYARRIQMGTMANVDEIQKALPGSFVLHLPKDIVSGDFYWFADNERYTVFSAIDCTGHGIPGAFISIMGNNYLHRILDTNEHLTAAKILAQLDEYIKAGFDNNLDYDIEDGMDMALCLIDKKEKCIKFSGAKNPIIYIEEGEVHKIMPNKYPIGGTIYAEKSFDEQVISIDGEKRVFYMFSDGFQDQFGGEKNKKFKAKRMYELFQEIHAKPFAEQKIILQDTIHSWKGEVEQTDDILIVGFSV